MLLHQEEEDFIADTLGPLSLTDNVSWQGGKEGKEVNWKAESIFLECVIIKEEFITVPTSSTPLDWVRAVLQSALLELGYIFQLLYYVISL